MNDFTKLKYTKVRSFKSATFVQLDSLEEFVEAFTRSGSQKVFFYEKKPVKGIGITKYLFFYRGLMYGLDGKGYLTLGDMKTANTHGFDGADRHFSIENGTAYHSDEERSRQSNEADIFYYAKNLGYDECWEFEDAIKKGFREQNSTDYRKAMELGFENAREFAKLDEYTQAMKKEGFESIMEYKLAHSLGLDDKVSYKDYLILTEAKNKHGFATIQEAHLFLILNRKSLPREKKLKDLVTILEKENPRNWTRLNSWNGRNTNWYSEEFRNFKNIEDFLINNKQIAGVGIYYPDKKSFISFSDQTILIDGSNIAWNGGARNHGVKPIAANIKLVIEELRKKGFSDIRAFCDANLPYDVKDPDVLSDLEKNYEVKKLPARTEADHYIIEFAKQLNAYIVTTDSFNDWAIKDAWVMQNRDRVRVAAIISNGLVSFSSNLQNINQETFKNIDSDFHGFETLQLKDKYDLNHFIIDPDENQRQRYMY